ncbi:MAG: YitT family protein [Proteobacteria bacterium]|nr:YitT family protein [Pseudomonadota bacterium]
MIENSSKGRLQEDLQYLVYSIKTWRFWQTILLIIIGSLGASVAINGILVNNNFFDGGVSGISLLIFYLTDWPPLGVIYFSLNIPIFIVCWREMSLKFVIVSLLGAIIFSTALVITKDIRINIEEPMMAAILSGIIIGGSVGLFIRFGGSTGGIEMIAFLLKKKFSIPMGNTIITINFIPLCGALIVYDLNIALYTGIYMFVESVMLEKVQTGFSQRKTVFIISHKPEFIAEQVMKRLDRGVTFLHASGAWTKQEHRMIYTVINMRELGRLKELLFLHDPDAFVAISNTAEVIGNRFLTWEDEGFSPVGLEKKV